MFFYLKNCPYSGGKSWTDRLWSLSIKADSYANEFLPLCQILFFFFFKWRCFNKNCFLSWKCFRKKESRSLYRDAIRKGLFTTPGKIILGKKKKKKVLQPAKLICQLLHKKAGISLMENFLFFFMDETQCWCYGGALGVYSRRSAEFWHFSTVFNLNHARLTAAQVNYLVNSGSLTL